MSEGRRHRIRKNQTVFYVYTCVRKSENGSEFVERGGDEVVVVVLLLLSSLLLLLLFVWQLLLLAAKCSTWIYKYLCLCIYLSWLYDGRSKCEFVFGSRFLVCVCVCVCEICQYVVVWDLHMAPKLPFTFSYFGHYDRRNERVNTVPKSHNRDRENWILRVCKKNRERWGTDL